MDDRGDGVEEGKCARSGCFRNGSGQRGGGEGAGGNDRGAIGELIDPLADNGDIGVSFDRARDFVGERPAIDRQCRPGWDAVKVGRAHHQAAERAHFLVE